MREREGRKSFSVEGVESEIAREAGVKRPKEGGREGEREKENGCQATMRGATSSIDRYPATSSGAGCVGGRGKTPLSKMALLPSVEDSPMSLQ